MKRKHVGQFALGLLVALCLGCSADSNTLTRERAAELMEGTQPFQPKSQMILTDEEAVAAAKAGCFRMGPGISLTPLGESFFKLERTFPFVVLRPKTPVRYRVLEVTGIVEGMANSKEVRFIAGWNLDDFPAELRPAFEHLRKKGRTEFLKFDDGWRAGETEWR
jgi:hypothetical protein